MNANRPRFSFRITAGFLIPAVLFVPTIRAGETVAWVDLPKKLGDHPKKRHYRVVTKDGHGYAATQLVFSPNDVRLSDSGPSIMRDQVLEIRIPRHRPLWDAVAAPAAAVTDRLCSDCFDAFVVIPLILLDFAIVAVTLPIEGVKRLWPDKVIKVAP